MKNLFSCALALLFSSNLLAQSNIEKRFEATRVQLSVEQKSTVKPIKNIPNNKAPGDTLWSEDFTNGLPNGWYVQDNTGNNYDWVINNGPIQNSNLTPSGFTNASAIASNSGGNHMLLFGDEYNRIQVATTGAATDMDSYFQTAGIQVNNEAALSVIFQQKNRRCCSIVPAPVAVLSVSTDSTFATNFQEYDIIQGVPMSIQTPDPMNVEINISAIAANYTGKIWLRIHLQSGYSHYYWMVDDMHLVVPPANDLVTQSAYYGFTPVGTFGFQYTRIPATHIQSADFSMIVDNIGSADQTGTNLTVDINDGSTSIFNQSTTDYTLSSQGRDTLEMLGQWTPPATLGIPYTVTLDISSDSIDATPPNNTYQFEPFQISQDVIALDDYSNTPGNGGAQSDPNGATEHEIGNYFEAVISDIAFGIEFLAGSNTTIGTSIDAVLYRVSGNNYIEVARSANYVVQAADTTTPKTLALVAPLTGQSPIMQQDSLYFMGIHSFDDSFQIATSGTGPLPNTNSATHSTVSFPNRGTATTTYSLTRTPMIRLKLCDLDPWFCDIGINENKNSIKFTVFPNPSKGIFNINLSSNDENTVNLAIKNVVGQIVLTETVSVAGTTKHQISLADYSKGIYFLTIGNETVKLVIK